jgi:hypothetical protein
LQASAEVKPEEKKDWKMKLVHGTQTVISTIEDKAVKIKNSEIVKNTKTKIEENKVT